MIEKMPKLLRDARSEANLLQKDVGDYLGVTKDMISKYENGHVTPPTEHLGKLAVLYKKPVDYFYSLNTREMVYIDKLRPDNQELVKTLVERLEEKDKQNI